VAKKNLWNYRINRASYWLLVAVAVGLVFVLTYFGKRSSIFEIALVLVAVPRLHDIGRSGWIVAGVIALEIAVIGIAAVASGDPEIILTASGAFVVFIALLGIWLGAIPGEPHANKWGPPPAPGLSFNKPADDYEDTFG
jgi:uncharacterized membrane protein YhaH (DUF805 family)